MKTSKKVLFIGLCFLSTAFTASAQFKIHSNGNMSFKKTGSSQPSSPIALAQGGASSESKYFMSYQGDYLLIALK